MSGYPYGQGQWPPSQPAVPHPRDAPLPSYDYSHQSNIPFPMMYGGFPYQTVPQPQSTSPQFPASTAYYSASEATQVAFEHNANTYMAGDSSTAANGSAPAPVLSPVPGPRSPGAVGGDLCWSQAFPTRQTATPSAYNSYPHPPAQQFPSGHSVYQKQDQQQQQLFSGQQHAPSLPQRVVYSPPAYLTSGPSAPPASQNINAVETRSKNSDLEEGELNEEDMDDEYDPEDNDISGSAIGGDISIPGDELNGNSKQQSLDLPGAVLEQAAARLGSPPSRDASVVDTQEDEFYDEEEEEEPGEVKSTGKSASPSDAADADDEDMGFSDSSEHGSTPAIRQEHAKPMGNAQAHVSVAAVAAANGDAVASANDNSVKSVSPNRLASTDRLVPTDTSGVDSSSKHQFATLEQGKKEAQRAILRLIPYGVNFQTYIDEGFDEKVIKPLFAELGLKTAPTNPAAQLESSKPPSPQLSAASVVPTAPGAVDSESGPKKEERKDRIARLLALKNTSKPIPAQTPPTANAQAHLTPPAPQQAHSEKTKSEKEKLLQQKLGKLRRAQELREAAAAKARAQATALGKTIGNEQDASVLDHPVIAATETVAATSAQTEQKPTTTGPLLDGAVSAVGTGSRKRPVAADFVDFVSTPANPLKRPFSMTRQESSLVIDISDDSDNDVEMELESQTDETPVKSIVDGRPTRGGPSFRDRPPLPEQLFPSRQHGHAPSSIRTPPRGPARSSSRTKDDEYAKKLRQIEEMKRKIAKAEAMKVRSSTTGSLTPQTAISSPQDSSDALRREAQGVRSGSHTAGVANGTEHGTMEEGAPALEKRQPRAFEASDAVSSRSSSRTSHHEQRARIASQQLPRVEASLQEKMFKLKLFQEKIAALEAEINTGIAEKQRLKEEMDALAGESEDEESRVQSGSMPTQQATEVEADAKAETDAQAEADARAEADAQVVAGVDPSQDRNAGFEPPVPDGPDHQVPNPVTEAPTQLDDGNNEPATIAEPSVGSSADSEVQGNNSGGGQSRAESKRDARSEPESSSESDSGPESAHMSDATSLKEPTPDILDGDGDVIMEDDAVPDEDVVEQQKISSAELLEPPSRAAARERASGPQHANAHGSTATVPSMSTFIPYESPLQNFSSFRFHPKYKDQVKGGLKSLTFSGRIQDDVALCPYELEGETCPDPACGFQHFASMVPKDDQLLVELGRSDDFSGEKKAQFVNGLKDLLKRVRDANVRDFDTIADEIIRFRRSFLGDDSKVVSHLEDVTI